MRASTTVTLLCLAASVAPSVAPPSIKSERGIDNAAVNKAFGNEVVKATVSALTATGVLTLVDSFTSGSSNHRALMERFDKRIKQELAARASKRELLTTGLDNLD